MNNIINILSNKNIIKQPCSPGRYNTAAAASHILAHQGLFQPTRFFQPAMGIGIYLYHLILYHIPRKKASKQIIKKRGCCHEKRSYCASQKKSDLLVYGISNFCGSSAPLPDLVRLSSVQTVKPLKAWYIKPLPFWVYQSTNAV